MSESELESLILDKENPNNDARYILGKLNPLLSDTKYKSDRLIYELMGICINSYPYDAIRQLEERMVQIKDTDKTKFLKYQKLLDEVKRDIETMKRR